MWLEEGDQDDKRKANLSEAQLREPGMFNLEKKSLRGDMN